MTPGPTPSSARPSVEQAFAQVLRAARLERGLSQEQLGFQIDSGRTYVSELERGVHSPTLKWLFRFAEILDFSASDLVQRVEALRANESPPRTSPARKRR